MRMPVPPERLSNLKLSKTENFVPRARLELACLSTENFKFSADTDFAIGALVPEISASPAGLQVHFTRRPRPRSLISRTCAKYDEVPSGRRALMLLAQLCACSRV